MSKKLHTQQRNKFRHLPIAEKRQLVSDALLRAVLHHYNEPKPINGAKEKPFKLVLRGWRITARTYPIAVLRRNPDGTRSVSSLVGLLGISMTHSKNPDVIKANQFAAVRLWG